MVRAALQRLERQKSILFVRATRKGTQEQVKVHKMKVYLSDLEVILGQLSGGRGVLGCELLAVSAPRCVELHQ